MRNALRFFVVFVKILTPNYAYLKRRKGRTQTYCAKRFLQIQRGHLKGYLDISKRLALIISNYELKKKANEK